MTTRHQDHRIDPFGRRIAMHLDMAVDGLPHHVTERLRAARARAVSARLVTAPKHQTAQNVQIQNGVAVLHFGDEGLNLWSRLASLFPLIALVAGLLLLKTSIDDHRADQLAEVDAALLTDDLPPSAYTDPGFLQFLKTAPAADAQDQPN